MRIGLPPLRLGEIWTRAGQLAERRPVLYVDATGVGQPIVDVLKANCPRARIMAVYFTYGDRRLENRSERSVVLGKAHLVSRL